MCRPLHRITSGRERQRRIDECVAEFDRDRTGDPARDEVVLADRHVRTVLLGASSVDDGVRLPGLNRLLHFRPGEIFDVDRALRHKGSGGKNESRRREGQCLKLAGKREAGSVWKCRQLTAGSEHLFYLMLPVCPKEYRPGCGHTERPCGSRPTGIRCVSFSVEVSNTYTSSS